MENVEQKKLDKESKGQDLIRENRQMWRGRKVE